MVGQARILVLGAINQDETARVDHQPAPGETVVVASTDFSPGGKGANQAAAASQSGFAVQVQMLGAVGEDPAGDEQLLQLDRAGVDRSMVRRVIGTPTGRAFITVTSDGENSITVALGANGFVSLVNLHGAATPDVAVAQTEIGRPAVEALGKFVDSSHARLVVNNAPVIDLSSEILAQADPLVVNRGEAHQMLGELGPKFESDDRGLATALRTLTGAQSVVVTLGEHGCAVVDSDGGRTIKATPVERVVDTTGAGDVFIGVLASALASARSLDEAVGAASQAAAQSTTWRGARIPLDSPISNLTSA